MAAIRKLQAELASANAERERYEALYKREAAARVEATPRE